MLFVYCKWNQLLFYHSLLAYHISEEMKTQTHIEDLLRGKAMDVLVPREWTGIKGIEPIDLKFKRGLPERVKPQARPINPRLWETCEKEFWRMSQYMSSTSRSSCASCLVVYNDIDRRMLSTSFLSPMQLGQNSAYRPHGDSSSQCLVQSYRKQCTHCSETCGGA
jgi:hypothetical protein